MQGMRSKVQSVKLSFPQYHIIGKIYRAYKAVQFLIRLIGILFLIDGCSKALGQCNDSIRLLLSIVTVVLIGVFCYLLDR